VAESCSNKYDVEIIKADGREWFRMCVIEDIPSTLYDEGMIESPDFSSLPLRTQKKINEYCELFEIEPFSTDVAPNGVKRLKQGDVKADTLSKSLECLQRLNEAIDDLRPLIGDSIEYSKSFESHYERKKRAIKIIFEAVKDLGLVKEHIDTQHSSNFLVSDAYSDIGKLLNLLQPLVRQTINRSVGQTVVEEFWNDGLFNKIADYFNQTNREEE